MSAVLIPLSIITVLILLNGLFVAAEFAIVGAPRPKIARRAEEGSGTARRVLSILRSPDRQNQYLATAQIGITVVSLGLGMYGEHVVAEWLLGPLEYFGYLAEPAAHIIATVLSVGVLTYLHVVIGEMVPKSIALQAAEKAVLRLSPAMTIMEKLLYPLSFVLNGIGNFVVRLLGIPPADAHSRFMSPEELEIVVEESYEGGVLKYTEQLFIENIFDFSERVVGHAMTPRTRIYGFQCDAAEEDVLNHVCETRHSRYPIYDGNMDQIIGILHVKDLARATIHRTAEFDLRRLARDTVFVPESLSLEDMLDQFRQDRAQMAIVVDEFGGTAGIITLEDLVEEIVGEIIDEFDREETPPFEQVEERVVRVRGDLILEELNQHFDLKLEHPEADTVGGLIMAELGRVPQPEDTIAYAGISFEVEEVEGLAVQTAFVRLPAEDASEDQEAEPADSG